MGILNSKLSMIGNNIDTVILTDLTSLDIENEESLIVETIAGKKRILLDEEGTTYIIFNKVRYDIKDYKQMTLQDFLGGLKWEH